MSFAIDTFKAERFGKVTGSKCTVMFPLRGDGKVGQTTYAKQLATQKYFRTYEETDYWQTEHGKMAEHFAFLHYETYIDKRIEKGSWYCKGEIGGTIDAQIPKVKGIDFKCPTSLDKWLDYLYVGIDKDQRDQCQMYMHLTGLDQWEIAAFLIETQKMTDNGLVYPVEEKQRMIICKVEKDPAWAERLEEALPFVVGMRDHFYGVLEKTFGKRTEA